MRLAACCCCKVDTTQGDQLNLHLCSHSLLLQGGAKPQDQAAAQAGAPQMPQMPYGMGAYGYGAMPQVGGWKYPVVRKGWTACLQKTLASMRVHANRAARAATTIRHSALNTAPSALPLTSAVPLHGQPLWRLPLRCWLCWLCPARRPHLPAPGVLQEGARTVVAHAVWDPVILLSGMADCTQRHVILPNDATSKACLHGCLLPCLHIDFPCCPPLRQQAAGQAYGQQGYSRQQGYGLYEDQGASAGGPLCLQGLGGLSVRWHTKLDSIVRSQQSFG